MKMDGLIRTCFRSSLRPSMRSSLRSLSYGFNGHRDHSSSSSSSHKGILVPGFLAASGFIFYFSEKKKISAKSEEKVEKVYTAEEVSKHNTKDSIWVTYKGNVYDVTEFARSHPGGETNLMLAAGKDLGK